jgi:hypothetical protein
MTGTKVEIVARYYSRGIIVDTNLLLLLFVGSYSTSLIQRFKRTNAFTIDDYERLRGLLAPFARIVATPNILTEVNSLSSQLAEPGRSKYFEEFARYIKVLDERYVASKVVAQSPHFGTLGLTDSGILQVARDQLLVVTTDVRLYITLLRAGVDALNFNHLRSLD